MKGHHIYICFFLSFITALTISCSDKSDITGIERRNNWENCRETTYNADYTITLSIVSQLIPSVYNHSTRSENFNEEHESKGKSVTLINQFIESKEIITNAIIIIFLQLLLVFSLPIQKKLSKLTKI